MQVEWLRDVEQPERGVDGAHEVLVCEVGVDCPVEREFERGVVCRVVLPGLLCQPGKEFVHVPDATDAAEWMTVPGLA